MGSIMRAAVVAAILVPAASQEPPARFTITTRKADDTLAVAGDESRTTFDVKSPSGISRAVIERAGDA